MNDIDKTVEYFCNNSHSTASASKMEEELYRRACLLIVHRTIMGEDFKHLLADLEAQQETVLQQQPRWKKVNVQVTGGAYGTAWVHIGSFSVLCFQEIKGRYRNQ